MAKRTNQVAWGLAVILACMLLFPVHYCIRTGRCAVYLLVSGRWRLGSVSSMGWVPLSRQSRHFAVRKRFRVIHLGFLNVAMVPR